MQITSKNLWLIIGLGIFISQAYADNCDWAKKTPPDDADYKYFVARGFSTKSREDALRNAENNITQKVCDVIGNYTSVATDSYETQIVSQSTSSTAQRNRCLGIYKQNFEQIETDDDRIDNEYIACVKYRYLKDSIKQEQDRMNREGSTPGSIALAERVGDAYCDGHPLTIRTNPDGAFVSIDDKKEYMAPTPVLFKNVCNGTHSLTITLNHYDTVEQKISSSDIQIFKELKRSTKRVRFTTNMGDSIIKISDSDNIKDLKSGKEPLEYDFLSGINYVISAENDKAHNVSINRTFNKNSENSYNFNLEKIKAKIDFAVFKERNPGVKIFVDGLEITGTETGSLTPDKTHNIVFKKSGGYKNIKKSVYLHPNEVHNYPSKELKFDTDKSIITKYDSLDEDSNLWLSLIYNTGTYSNTGFETPTGTIGVLGNYFFSKQFSIDFGLSLGATKTKAEYNSRNYTTYVQNTSAASVFHNYDMYYNANVEQIYAQLYGGLSWYFIQKFWFSPFLSVGYNQMLPLLYNVKQFDSNFADRSSIESRTKINAGGVLGGIGLQMGFFRITGRLGTNYQDISLGISIPMEL